MIIGGGGHGLAAAYYLASDHGITDVAVLEQSYLGGGGTGRNTAIVRSNYLTPEGVRFYDESVRLFQDLSADLDLNLFYSERGHFTLAHTDATLRTMRWRAEVNKHLGVKSELVGPAEIAEACPELDLVVRRSLSDCWARCITRPAPSRGTMPSPGATAARRTGAASRFISRRR